MPRRTPPLVKTLRRSDEANSSVAAKRLRPATDPPATRASATRRVVRRMWAAANLLIFDAAPRRGVDLDRRLRQRGLTPTRVPVPGTEPPPLQGFDLAVIALEGPPDGARSALERALRALVTAHVATIVWGDGDALRPAGGPLVDWVAADAGVEEVLGRVGALTRYAPLVRRLQRELENLARLGEQLTRHFDELDQEMRLAGRLQRDFLPREFPPGGPFRFHALYRPASWVSGDMYDVFRIDEDHVGLFIADAMGHGVAAGLLTMFLRQALVAKRVHGKAYHILSPADALQGLHDCLTEQHLPNCHFVTAAYGILDPRCATVRLARAGHPYPLRVSPSGDISEVTSVGSLLGLPEVPTEFEVTELRLRPGERLLFYTDGLEEFLLLPRTDSGGVTRFTPDLLRWATLPADQLIRAVHDRLDHATGSLNPADDVTLLLLEHAAAP